MIEMELLGVQTVDPGKTPIVLLRENNERGLLLPIYIGRNEALSIDLVLREAETPRPLTHDLFKTTLNEMEATLTRVVVTELKDKTFFAELHLSTQNGEKKISSRPSDAIALATRMQSPIFVEESVLNKAGEKLEDETQENVVAEFRDFLEEISPDDFMP
ncbi:MAG: bifunctional nuclease family protein [Actinomycetota bacterium]|nr:bifunctional nuclease family protein [Actinomycetota bacterium]MED5230272.1 bifunctional nuclease family protein [Actinomycetota bacterium]